MTNIGFNPNGIMVNTPDGDKVLNAGSNITILPSGGLITFASQIPPNVMLNGVAWQPPMLSDAKAPNNSVYFSSDSSKLSYKDSAGVPHSLY